MRARQITHPAKVSARVEIEVFPNKRNLPAHTLRQIA
jgi:hypothetical protein